MRIRYLVYAVILFICCACSKQKVSQQTLSDKYSVDTLNISSCVNLADLGVIGVDMIAKVDSILWLHQDYDGDKPLYCIKGNSVIKGASLGQGPDDLLEINSLQCDSTNGLYVYDSLKGAIFFYQANDSSLVLEKKLEAPRLLDDAVVIGHFIIAFPVTKEYSAAIIDENGRMVDSLLYFPPKPDGVADAVHALACTGTTASMPSGEFARCVAYDGGVDFYTITNDRLKHVNRFSLFNMEYDVLDQGIPVPVPSKKSKTGFSAVKSSGDRFYASFSDNPGFENPEGLCDRIYRFSRDGQLEQVYAFDCEFADFSVDADNKELLLLTRENENDLIRSYMLQ